MNGGLVLTIVAMAAIWPFGRDRDERVEKPDPTGTIKDLEYESVEVDTSATIASSTDKAMESYRLFLDLAAA